MKAVGTATQGFVVSRVALQFSLIVAFAARVIAASPVGELVVPSDVPQSPDATDRLLTTAQQDGLFKVGPFEIFPLISGTVYYDDNINSTSTNRLKDTVWTVAPRFTAAARNSDVEREKSFTLDYTPVFRFFIDNDQLDSIDHAARINGRWSGAGLTLGFDQAFLADSQPLPDVGGRADTLTSDTSLTSEWRLGYKTSLEVDAALMLIDYNRLTSSRDWSNSDWLNYRLSPKLSLGVGVTLGYVEVEAPVDQPLPGDVDQTYTQMRVRAVCFVTGKINLNAWVGGEIRQYRGGATDTILPVWDIVGAYRPWRNTTLKLILSQRNHISAGAANLNYLSTSARVVVTQRIFDRFVATVDGNFRHADYRTTTANDSSDRRDNIFLGHLGLDAYITEHWNVGIYYAYERDSSSDGVFSYRKNQFGLQSSWTF